jgi:hypothetical protein
MVGLMRCDRIFGALVMSLFLCACAGTSQETDKGLPVQCVDRPDPGPCAGQLPRFWYDYRTDSCRMFLYGGCGGRVPFQTRADCARVCLAVSD